MRSASIGPCIPKKSSDHLRQVIMSFLRPAEEVQRRYAQLYYRIATQRIMLEDFTPNTWRGRTVDPATNMYEPKFEDLHECASSRRAAELRGEL